MTAAFYCCMQYMATPHVLDVVGDILLVPQSKRSSALELQLVNLLCEPRDADHSLPWHRDAFVGRNDCDPPAAEERRKLEGRNFGADGSGTARYMKTDVCMSFHGRTGDCALPLRQRSVGCCTTRTGAVACTSTERSLSTSSRARRCTFNRSCCTVASTPPALGAVQSTHAWAEPLTAARSMRRTTWLRRSLQQPYRRHCVRSGRIGTYSGADS